MTLREMISKNPLRFYGGQTWYANEAFMDTPAAPLSAIPCGIRWPGDTPHKGDYLVSAASLVAAYLTRPDNWVWSRYLWTSDVDAKGQRVYVGGVGPHNGHTLEIHRHLALTIQWGTPIFV